MIRGGYQESNSTLKKVYNWLFIEQNCQLCRTTCHDPICEHCYKTLAFNIYACPYCAHPCLPGELCKECITQNFYFDQAIAPFEYHADIKKLIAQIKYHSNFLAVEQLCRAILEKITELPDAILFVPSHASRQSQRGYNQSQIIAKYLSDQLNIPIFDCCTRKKSTDVLENKSKKQRRKLMQGAFECHQTLPEKIAIVDDVLTTGATVNELAKTIRKKGAKKIFVWAIARTCKD